MNPQNSDTNQDNIESDMENSTEEMMVDDVVFESNDEDGAVMLDPESKLKKLRIKLHEVEKEKTDYLNNWQRERADFVNYKKEDVERRKEYTRYAVEKMVNDLLPVLDSYDLAFANKDAWEKVDKNWRIGVEYIHQQLLKVLADYGVTEIEVTAGNIFDHNLHQSVETIETDDQSKDHTIERVIQKGYKTNDKVLRPVRVNVFTFKTL